MFHCMFDYVYTLSDLSAISLLFLPLAKPSLTAEKSGIEQLSYTARGERHQ